MMIVTHEMRFARDVSTRVFYMDEGGIYEDGSPKQIFEHPVREKTRRFILRLRTLPVTITSSATFDFLGFLSEIDRFSKDNMLSPVTTRHLQLLFEELIMQGVIPHLERSNNEYPIQGVIEYSERRERPHYLNIMAVTPLIPFRMGMKFPQDWSEVSQQKQAIPLIRTTVWLLYHPNLNNQAVTVMKKTGQQTGFSSAP